MATTGLAVRARIALTSAKPGGPIKTLAFGHDSQGRPVLAAGTTLITQVWDLTDGTLRHLLRGGATAGLQIVQAAATGPLLVAAAGRGVHPAFQTVRELQCCFDRTALCSPIGRHRTRTNEGMLITPEHVDAFRTFRAYFDVNRVFDDQSKICAEGERYIDGEWVGQGLPCFTVVR